MAHAQTSRRRTPDASPEAALPHAIRELAAERYVEPASAFHRHRGPAARMPDGRPKKENRHEYHARRGPTDRSDSRNSHSGHAPVAELHRRALSHHHRRPGSARHAVVKPAQPRVVRSRSALAATPAVFSRPG